MFSPRPTADTTSVVYGNMAFSAGTPDSKAQYHGLWLVTTRSSASISPLGLQIVRGRTIVLTENPELHLV